MPRCLVDGEEVAVTWPGGGKPAVVTVTPGKHKIMVKKDGIETSGDEVTVRAGVKRKVHGAACNPRQTDRPVSEVSQR